MEFNPDFVARMIPKVEWAALLEAAETVRTLPHARVHLPGEWGGGEWSHRQPRARGGTPGDDLGLCPQLHLVEVPKGPIEGYEHDEKFLRQMHHVLLEVRASPSLASPATQPQPEAAGTQLCSPLPRRWMCWRNTRSRHP